MTYQQYLNRLREEMDEANSQAQAEYEWLGENQPIEADPELHPDLFDEDGKLKPIPDEW
jgi:hypothetical protein